MRTGTCKTNGLFLTLVVVILYRSISLNIHELRTAQMKEVTLKIPEKKLTFFLELRKQLGFEVAGNDVVIPEEHKKIVRERIKYTNPETYVSWEEARRQLKVKGIKK